MSKKEFVIDNQKSLDSTIAALTEIWTEKKYLIVRYSLGQTRTLSQNALLHLWVREAAAFYLGKPLEEVTEIDMDAMKTSIKAHCLLDNPNFKEYLIVDLPDPMGKKCATDVGKQRYASSKHWGRDGAYHIMTWFQIRAAFDGLTLLSKGEFEQRQLSTTA